MVGWQTCCLWKSHRWNGQFIILFIWLWLIYHGTINRLLFDIARLNPWDFNERSMIMSVCWYHITSKCLTKFLSTGRSEEDWIYKNQLPRQTSQRCQDQELWNSGSSRWHDCWQEVDSSSRLLTRPCSYIISAWITTFSNYWLKLFFSMFWFVRRTQNLLIEIRELGFCIKGHYLFALRLW